VVEDDGEGADPDMEEDLEPLPPRRHRRTGGTREGRHESLLTAGGTQVQERVSLSFGRQSDEIPSSQTSRHSNARGPGSWATGGTPIQRTVMSSLGRRSRDNLSSEASRYSELREKRLRVASGLATELPSSPPTTLTLSMSSDPPNGGSEKRVSRKHLKKEHVPDRNDSVMELAQKYLHAEVLACNPWPDLATTESLIRRSWTSAWKSRDDAIKSSYPGSGRLPNQEAPTKEPDEVSSGIVSTNYAA
jgi:hypothetical protein